MKSSPIDASDGSSNLDAFLSAHPDNYNTYFRLIAHQLPYTADEHRMFRDWFFIEIYARDGLVKINKKTHAIHLTKKGKAYLIFTSI